MDCFEPIFGFPRSFWFQKYRSDTWDPKVMFSAPSGHSDYHELSHEDLKFLNVATNILVAN